MEKLLSIIIPVYNMEKYLQECLQSLQKQNFPDSVEILLIDDGSKDQSPVMCDRIAAEDPHFHVIHQKNGGVANARNRGLAEASGEYIAWLDPDDYITDEWWKVIAPVLEKKPDLILFDSKYLTNGNFQEVHYDQKSRIISRDEWMQELMDDYRLQSQLWSKIFPKRFFPDAKTFDENLSFLEDYQAMNRLTYQIKSCIYLHDCLYVYRQLDSSIIHDRKKYVTNMWLKLRLAEERSKFFSNHNIKISADHAVLYAAFSFCYAYALEQPDDEEMKQQYQYRMKQLHRRKAEILQSDRYRWSIKLRFVALLTHFIFLIRPLRQLKRYLQPSLK